MTQPNPYPTEPPYIEQQLACRKKISLCASCHHHHPNAHRNNANTHSITSITVILGLFQTDEAVMHQLQVFTKRICQPILDTKLHIYTTCIFRTSVISDPWPNPTRGSTQPMDNSGSRWSPIWKTFSQVDQWHPEVRHRSERSGTDDKWQNCMAKVRG